MPIIKSEISSKILELRVIYICLHALARFPILKDFSDKFVVKIIMNMMFDIVIMKCVTIWKISLPQ